MKFVIGTVIALLIAACASAANFTYKACTKDNKLVSTIIELDDNKVAADTRIPAYVDRAFKQAASELTAEAFQSYEGYLTFVSYIRDEDADAIVGDIKPPQIIADSCN